MNSDAARRREQKNESKLPIGPAVRVIMLDKGLTTVTLAMRADMTRQQVWRVVAEVTEPALGTLERVAVGLGVSVSTIVRTAEEIAERADAYGKGDKP